MKKLINKILFYKRMALEVLETLQTICFVISQSRNPPTQFRNALIGHATILRIYSSTLKAEITKAEKGGETK
jgi:hypothetical protein